MPTSIQRKRLAAIAVTVILGGLTTAVSWWYARSMHHESELHQFDRRVSRVEAAIRDRFAAYEQVLRAGVALFKVNDHVSRTQWRDFVASLQAEVRYPGIQGIGYAERLDATGVAAHEAEVQADGFADYRVYPALQGDAQGSAIKYLEPFDARNQRAFGYDMYSNPVRRAAMARARDSGQPALTGHVVLLQETEQDRQAGTLLYLPLYRHGMPLDTVEQRRKALQGWIYSPFRMDDLMQGILGDSLGSVHLDLFDGTEANPQRLLFHLAADQELDALFSRQVSMQVAGQPWLLSLTMSDPEPDVVSALVLAGGSLLTLLLATLVLSISRSERRSVELAMDMTQALRTSEERQSAIVQSSADGIVTIDQNGIVRTFNRAAERIFGYKADEVVGKGVDLLLPPRFQRQESDAYLLPRPGGSLAQSSGLHREMVGQRRDGEEFPVRVALNTMPSTGGRQEYVAMVSDISHRKKAERLLAEAHNQRRSILDNAPFAIISTDAQGLIQTINPAAEKLLHYRAAELIGRQTPALLHEPGELYEYAADMTRRLGRPIQAGFEALVARANTGHTDDREWTYLRQDGGRIPVQATTTALRSASGLVEGYLIIAYDITERKNAQSYVQHLAHHDPLTNLPNRVLLQDRLEQAVERARRQNEQVAVLMVDLDYFKRINDSLGHHVGDDLLLAVADRLSRAVRRVDTVSRLGGDEFVVVIPGIREADAVGKIVDPLMDALSAPFRIQEHELTVTPSIGVSLYPEHGEGARTLLKHADTAMYQAKEIGRHTWRLFAPDMLKHNQHRLDVENALRKALERDEMSLAYQPQVDFRSGEVVGCEALLRWRNPRLGNVSPGMFVPLAEEMGLIQPIGEWVLRTACRQVAEMQRQLGRELHVAVNISPRQFFQADLPDMIQDALADSGLAPECLEIEITEGVLVENAEDTIEALRRIRALGVQVAIDDFGTGYSSLSYLTCFPIDKLKIDQSFVRDITSDPNDAAVTSAIIVMAHTLHLQVVAEGVESEAQYNFLAARDCDVAQGYYFGRPQARDLFVEAVAKWAGSDPDDGAADSLMSSSA